MEELELAILHGIQALRVPALDVAMTMLSLAGSYALIWLVIAAALLARKTTRQAGAAAVVSIALAEIAVAFLKPIFMRPRPFMVDSSVALIIDPPGDWSFPSGHAAVACACAVTIAMLLGTTRWNIWLPIAALAVLMTFSRLYLFVHWPTDVLAGAVLGAGVGTIVGLTSRGINKLAQQRGREHQR